MDRRSEETVQQRIVRRNRKNKEEVFFFNDTATTEIYTLSLHDALPISGAGPALFAISDEAGPLERIARAICRVFQAHGLESTVYHSSISARGVHRI